MQKQIRNIDKWNGKVFPTNYSRELFYKDFGTDYFISVWSLKVYHIDNYGSIDAPTLSIELASEISWEDEQEIAMIIGGNPARIGYLS